MALSMSITKTRAGVDYVYEFRLWDEKTPGVTFSERLIENGRYDGLKRAILSIRDHILDYRRNLAKDPRQANNIYRAVVEDWLRDVSKMINKEFLPPPNTSFAARLTEIEESARAGDSVVMEVVSNDYLVPWWLSSSYTSEHPGDLWGRLFALGFVPAYASHGSPMQRDVREPRIALISRPTSDLRNAADIRTSFRKMESPSERVVVDIRNGGDNAPRSALGRFGLLREQIEESFSKNQILFYYGHFELDEEFPERSYLEALSAYAAGRKESDIPPDRISLSSIKQFLEGKILFLDACRSIGLPYSGDDPFPPNNKVLPQFYARNRILCIGTVYPIFDDAAVDYMRLFANLVLEGTCLGEAVRGAREGLSEESGYSSFDWAPYVLVGNPGTQVQV